MGTRAVESGSASTRVAANVRALRDARGLSLRDLSKRMGEVGRPILASGLSKIEKGDRRVDVDDLIALAVALDVSPNRLLLPAGSGDDKIELTPTAEITAQEAWRWATGDELPHAWWQRKNAADIDRAYRFRRENRPHDPPDDMPVAEVEKHTETLMPVVDAIQAARADGVPMNTILSYVSLMETMRDVSRAVSSLVIPDAMQKMAERARMSQEDE